MRSEYLTLQVWFGDAFVGTFEIPSEDGWLQDRYIEWTGLTKGNGHEVDFAQYLCSHGACQVEDDRLVWWAGCGPAFLRMEHCEVNPQRESGLRRTNWAKLQEGEA
jgi:hypothetical protein